MRAFATFSLPDGAECSLSHGDLVGRLTSAAMRFDDPAISEAHAMVALRGGDLRLLSLRGLFAIDGRPLQDVVLQAGQRIEFSREIAVEVVAVALPDAVLALQGEGMPRQALGGAVSLVVRPSPMLHSRYRDDADAWLWWSEDGWRLRVRGGGTTSLEPGQSFEAAGRRFEATQMALVQAGQERTHGAGAIQAPLVIRARFDTVHLLRDGAPPVAIAGQSARILSELATLGTAVGWEPIAEMLWRDASLETGELRRRWDIALVRLRAKLREAGIRPDLVRATGSGCFELVLAEGDVVIDET